MITHISLPTGSVHKVKTHPAIPSWGLDAIAVSYPHALGNIIGTGKTEQEAIEDLITQLVQRAVEDAP